MIVGLVVFLLYLYFFVGFGQILTVIEHVNVAEYAFLYFGAIGSMLLVIFFWVVSWRHLLGSFSKVSFKNAFMYYWIGYFSDMVIPGQGVCGELTRMYLVKKDTKADYGEIAACGVTNRIVSYTVVTVGLSIGLAYLLITPAMFGYPAMPSYVLAILLVGWVGSVIHIGVLLYLALSDRAVVRIASFIFKTLKFLRIKRYSSEESQRKTFESLGLFHEGSRFFSANPRCLVLPFIFQIASYVLSLAVYALILSTLGIPSFFLSFFLVVYFVGGALQEASAVFSVGATEIILTSVFVFYGFDAASSGVAVAMLRSVTFWFPVVVGYIIFQVVGARKMLLAKACVESTVGSAKENAERDLKLSQPRDIQK
jgi:glycosyltransferase 2 family protein